MKSSGSGSRGLVNRLGSWSLGKGALHFKLARALMNAIRNGDLPHEGALPSERNLAAALTVSRTTVVAAYDALRDAGWVERRAGSGTRVRAGSPVVASARAAAHGSALTGSPLLGLLRHREDESDVIDFALGTPFPLKLPQELFTLPPEEYAALTHDRLYHPLGIESLREAIARHYTESGLPTQAGHVLVTNGSQQAIALSAALFLQRGDTVLVEDPAYFGALDAFRSVGARLSSLPVEANGVLPAAIRERIRATAARLVYLTPTFQNPTGAVMPAAARREVCAIAVESGVTIIDDRTLADISLEGRQPPGLAEINPAAPILTIGSLSKLMWPGIRVGWIRASEPLIERLARVKTAMDLGSPLLTQAIAARLMGEIGQARKMRRLELKPRRDLLVSLFRKHLPEFGFRVPEGGLFLWVRLSSGDGRRFAQVALRHGISILPGTNMSADESQAGYIRVPFLAEESIIERGFERLAAAWKEYEGIEAQHKQRAIAVI